MKYPKRKTPPRSRPKNVQAHAYDEEAGTLTVTFASGKRYRYSDVPKDLATGFEEAGGSGSYLHKHIAGVCPHHCLDGEDEHE